MKMALIRTLRGLAIIGAGLILWFCPPALYNVGLSWPWRYAALLLIGTVFCISLLVFSYPRLLRFISLLPFCSPNWLSIQRTWVVWLGQYLFFTAVGVIDLILAGFLIEAFGLILDRIDGKQAKARIASIIFIKPANYSNNPMADESNLWAWYAVEEEDENGEKILVDKRIVLEEWIRILYKGNTVVPMFIIEFDTQAKPPAPRVRLSGIGEWLDPLIDKLNFLPILFYLAHRDMLPRSPGHALLGRRHPDGHL